MAPVQEFAVCLSCKEMYKVWLGVKTRQYSGVAPGGWSCEFDSA